jgi:Zn-dependent M16 (insulinase) family peptidase
LKVLFSCLAPYYYGGDPYSALNFDADRARLENERKQGRFFEAFIQKELLDNQHRGLLTVVPDTELEEGKRQIELKRLAAVEATLWSGQGANRGRRV